MASLARVSVQLCAGSACMVNKQPTLAAPKRAPAPCAMEWVLEGGTWCLGRWGTTFGRASTRCVAGNSTRAPRRATCGWDSKPISNPRAPRTCGSSIRHTVVEGRALLRGVYGAYARISCVVILLSQLAHEFGKYVRPFDVFHNAEAGLCRALGSNRRLRRASH